MRAKSSFESVRDRLTGTAQVIAEQIIAAVPVLRAGRGVHMKEVRGRLGAREPLRRKFAHLCPGFGIEKVLVAEGRLCWSDSNPACAGLTVGPHAGDQQLVFAVRCRCYVPDAGNCGHLGERAIAAGVVNLAVVGHVLAPGKVSIFAKQ